jgi:serine/threonine protein kinase
MQLIAKPICNHGVQDRKCARMTKENGGAESTRIFGKYELIAPLAAGGMGEIFLARRIDESGAIQQVVAKSLQPRLAKSGRSVNRFLDEARIASTLSHPNIISIHDVGEWQGRYYIMMELIQGVTISQLMRANLMSDTLVPDVISASVIRDVAHALDYAHTARDVSGEPMGLIHRDISPQNIMVRTDGVVKVLDFGIAKAASNTVNTTTGNIPGKIRYMPPEQVRSEVLDGRGDQFALGVVFWEMLSHRRLYGEVPDVSARIVERPVPAPSSINPKVSKAFDLIATKMMGFNRDERYASCQEVVEALDQALSNHPDSIALKDWAPHIVSIWETQSQRLDALPTASDAILLSPLPPPADDEDETVPARPIHIQKPKEEPENTRNWLGILMGLLGLALLVYLVWFY